MSFPNILCSQAKDRGSLHRGVCAAQESSHFLSAQLKLLIYVISQSLLCKSACGQSNTIQFLLTVFLKTAQMFGLEFPPSAPPSYG